MEIDNATFLSCFYKKNYLKTFPCKNRSYPENVTNRYFYPCIRPQDTL